MKIIRRLGTALLAAVLCASVLCVPALADGEDVTISLSQTTIYLPVGQSQKVTATASDGKAVTWVSLTSGVASVDSAGNITALAEGSATVQAKSADGSAVANCKVIAYMAFPSYALRVGESLSLDASFSGTWTSADESVATVSSSGTVTGQGFGRTYITVRSA